jgi:hypothetical protein
MELSKSTVQGIGVLALLGVLAGAGLLVVKPQIESAFELQTEIRTVEDSTELRSIRLTAIQTQSPNLNDLDNEVNSLLEKVPSTKDVGGIAAAVVQALPTGVTLNSFSHGVLKEGGPATVAPESSLVAGEVPLTLEDEAAPAAAPAAGAAPVDGPPPTAEEGAAAEGEAAEEGAAPAAPAPVDPNNVPAFAGAPFIVVVDAASPEILMTYLDNLQNQDRLITVTAITSTDSGVEGGLQATIYAYAFAGNTPIIAEWEKAQKEPTQ